jgi:hypothetical protein
VKPETTDITNRTNPAAALAVQTTRTWNDSLFGPGDPRTGNYVPDCDRTSRVLNGECGAMDNRNFGTTVVTTRFDPGVTSGWFVRPYNLPPSRFSASASLAGARWILASGGGKADPTRTRKSLTYCI